MWRHTTSPACWKTHGSIYASSSRSRRLRMKQRSMESQIKSTTRTMTADQVLKVMQTDLGTEYVGLLPQPAGRGHPVATATVMVAASIHLGLKYLDNCLDPNMSSLEVVMCSLVRIQMNSTGGSHTEQNRAPHTRTAWLMELAHVHALP